MKILSILAASLMLCGAAQATPPAPTTYTLSCVSSTQLSPVSLSVSYSANQSHRRTTNVNYTKSGGSSVVYGNSQIAVFLVSNDMYFIVADTGANTGLPVLLFSANTGNKGPNSTFYGTVTEYPGTAPNTATYTGGVKCSVAGSR